MTAKLPALDVEHPGQAVLVSSPINQTTSGPAPLGPNQQYHHGHLPNTRKSSTRTDTADNNHPLFLLRRGRPQVLHVASLLVVLVICFVSLVVDFDQAQKIGTSTTILIDDNTNNGDFKSQTSNNDGSTKSGSSNRLGQGEEEQRNSSRTAALNVLMRANAAGIFMEGGENKNSTSSPGPGLRASSMNASPPQSSNTPPRIIAMPTSIYAAASLHTFQLQPKPTREEKGTSHVSRLITDPDLSANIRLRSSREEKKRMETRPVSVPPGGLVFTKNDNKTNTFLVDDAKQEECQPVFDWQTDAFPNCNSFHEFDMKQQQVSYLGDGTIRNAWNVPLSRPVNITVYHQSPGTNTNSTSILSSRANNLHHQPMSTTHTVDIAVLKTLRFEKENAEFSPHRQEAHRKDAIISERLSWSTRVVDVYGYCAQSCFSEHLDMSLEQYRKKHNPKATESLRLARDAALALADVHSVDSEEAGYVTIIHKDVTHRNYLVAKDGKTLKINDFNIAQLPYWDDKSQASCGVRKDDCTTYRSPEECRGDTLTEKMDLYMLGNTLYYILTGKDPLYKVRIKEARKRIANGETSDIPSNIDESTDPAVVVLLKVVRQCWAMDPNDRPSARDVAITLADAYDNIKLQQYINRY